MRALWRSGDVALSAPRRGRSPDRSAVIPYSSSRAARLSVSMAFLTLMDISYGCGAQTSVCRDHERLLVESGPVTSRHRILSRT